MGRESKHPMPPRPLVGLPAGYALLGATSFRTVRNTTANAWNPREQFAAAHNKDRLVSKWISSHHIHHHVARVKKNTPYG